MTDIRPQMLALIDEFGGRDAFRAAAGGVEAHSLKAALGKRMFPAAWFGFVAASGASRTPRVAVPLNLFGGGEKRWPDVAVILAPVEDDRGEAA